MFFRREKFKLSFFCFMLLPLIRKQRTASPLVVRKSTLTEAVHAVIKPDIEQTVLLPG